MLGVMLGRELPRSVHLRPSRGDGGIDVLDPVDDTTADVYQIKYFATSLTDDRKEQIRRSVRRIVANPNVRVRNWYLVVPLRPSAEELAWFRRYLSNKGVSGDWYGLHRVEGLAAKYVDVVDYYLGDGRAQLEESIRLLRDLARLEQSNGATLMTAGEATEPLAALYTALNRDDPHYRYEFQVTQALPPPAALPGLVASLSIGDNEGYVTHHVFAKFDAAPNYRPVPLTFNVHQDRMDAVVAAEWERALRYGTAVRLPHGIVSDLAIDLPGGLGASHPEASMWFGPARPEAAAPYRLRVGIVDDSSHLIAETVLDMEPITAGIAGKAIRAHGRDAGGVFELEILTDLATDGAPTNVHMRLSLLELVGLEPAAARNGVSVVAAFTRPHRIRFAPEYGPPAPEPVPIPAEEPFVTYELLELVQALADLQERIDGDIRVPDLATLTHRDYQEIVRAGRLARGETLTESWEGRTFTTTMQERVMELPTVPCQLALTGKQEIRIGTRSVVLSPMTMILLAAHLSTVADGDGRTVTATPALGNSTMLTMLGPIPDAPISLS